MEAQTSMAKLDSLSFQDRAGIDGTLPDSQSFLIFSMYDSLILITILMSILYLFSFCSFWQNLEAPHLSSEEQSWTSCQELGYESYWTWLEHAMSSMWTWCSQCNPIRIMMFWFQSCHRFITISWWLILCRFSKVQLLFISDICMIHLKFCASIGYYIYGTV